MRKISSTVSRSSGFSSIRTTARLSSWRCSRPSARNIGRYSETSIATGLAVDEVERGREPERAGVRDALGRADDEVAAGLEGRDEALVERVADLLGEVDDRVAAQHEVVGLARHRHAEQVAALERDHPAQLLDRLAVREVAVDRRAAGRRGRPRRRTCPARARATMRWSRSVPLISTRAGRDRLAAHGGERVGLGAVGAAGAPGAHAAAAGLGQLGQDRGGERRPLLGVAPELGDVDRDAVQEGVELVGVGRAGGGVLGEVLGPAARGPRADPALHLGALVLEQVDAAERADGLAERREVVARARTWGRPA